MRRTSSTALTVAASAVMLGLLAACGGSSSPGSPSSSAPATEFNPPGDIPDDQVFVDFVVPGSSAHVKVPEGWSKTTSGDAVTFTDHFNSVHVAVQPSTQAPTVQSATSEEVPALANDVSRFQAGDVTTIQRGGQTAILVTYQQDSAPDSTTGKVVRDAVERYEYWKNGQEVVLTLSGPKGADNVDPWRLISDSVTWK